MHLFVNLSRFFGFLALKLYSPGTLPESAFHTSIGGESTAVTNTYRKVWRIGQIIGWTLVALSILLIATLLVALF